MKILLLILICFNLSGQINKDGSVKHFYACTAISIGVSEIVYQTTDLDGLSPVIGFLAAFTINAGKEIIYDGYMHRGVKSLNDGIVGSFGAGTGAMIHRVIIDLHYRHKQKEFIKLTNSKRLLE